MSEDENTEWKKLPALSGLPYGTPVVGLNLTGSWVLRGLYAGDEYQVDGGDSCLAIVERMGTVLNASARLADFRVDLRARAGFLAGLDALGAAKGLDPTGGLIFTREGLVGRKTATWLVEDWNGDIALALERSRLTDPVEALAAALMQSIAPAGG